MEENTIPEVLKSHFLNLYQIALADGDFSELEMKMLYDFAAERGVPKSHLDKILIAGHTTVNLIPKTLREKIAYLHDFTVMIWADTIVTVDERVALEKYISRFGFLDENITSLANYLIDAVKDGKTKQDIIDQLN